MNAPSDPTPPPQPKTIARRFGYIGLPVVVIAAAILFLAYPQVSISNLRAAYEDSAQAVTAAVANSLWPNVAGFAATARDLPVADIRAHRTTAFLLNEVRTLTKGSRIMKMKLYDKRGFTVFSTDFAQIGRDYSAKPGFQAALVGQVASDFSHRDRFVGVNETVTDADIFGAYLPIRNASGGIEAVIELYFDVTRQYKTAVGAPVMISSLALIAIILLTALAVLLIFVERSERRVEEEREERIRVQRGLERAEAASRSKSEFLANMGHELRTPLNHIIGFSELIGQQRLGPAGVPQYADYAQDIHTSAVRLLEMFNDVLSFSQAEAGRMELTIDTIDPGEALKSAVARFRAGAEQKGLTLVCDTPPVLPPLETDRAKLDAIFGNILSNAVKFTPAGGRIVATIAFGAGGDLLDFEIADTGIGMRKEEIPVALSPFGQVDSGLNRVYEGTGLGLALTAKLVTLLEGALNIDSAPGQGTKVRVSLPLAEPSHRFSAA